MPRVSEWFSPAVDPDAPEACLKAMAFTAMAAGMGWGIRGQYGHETGAMLAGALASLTLILFFAAEATPLVAFRAASMATVAIGIGGSETYGQTLGLTHGKDFVGNWEAWRWGMLGVFIKGAVWIGFFGAFLGMGLGGKRYRPLEILGMLVALICLFFLGKWLLNSPFDPASRQLPRFYFSASWYFEPDKADLKPRPENWGGLLASLLGLVGYLAAGRRDWLAVRLAVWSFVAGGLGFSGGQCIQSYHAWNAEAFKSGWLSGIGVFRLFNWWNMMETSFGLIFGALVALGLWLNRRLIAVGRVEEDVTLSPTAETGLLSLHLVLLLTAEFLRIPSPVSDRPLPTDFYIDYPILMCVLPMVGIAGGRFWPYLQVLIVTAAPMMGKQMRDLCISAPAHNPHYPEGLGWLIFVMIPTAVFMVVAAWIVTHASTSARTRTLAAAALLTNVLFYFGINAFFFDFAWPWRGFSNWTSRTPNMTIFLVCTIFLSTLAVRTLTASHEVEPEIAETQ